MISLLEKVIKCLPPHLSELFDPESCSQGFCAWNNFWRDSFDRENVNDDFSALAHVHIYYENWSQTLTRGFCGIHASINLLCESLLLFGKLILSLFSSSLFFC